MKYVFINIKNFIRQETTIFCLAALCIACSVVVLCFSFGFYHHLEQKKLDRESGTMVVDIDFHDEERRTVTKGSMMDMLMQLDEDTLNGCDITMVGRYLEDKTDDPVIDHGVLSFPMSFTIQDGKVAASMLTQKEMEGSGDLDGSYFSAEQIENGELVCLARSEDMNWSGDEPQKWQKKYSPGPDGKYMVDGKKYTCIGHITTTLVPWVPVTTVADDCYIQQLYMEFEKPVTRRMYTEITELVRETYGEMAEIPALDIQEVDSMKFYNTLLVLCVLLAAVSGIVLSVLYEYILLQRKKQLAVYRLCGMTRRKAEALYFLECLFLSVVLYLLAVLLFHFVLLPYLEGTFEYIRASYSLYSYALLGILYTGVISVILYLMICRQTGEHVTDELKEA